MLCGGRCVGRMPCERHRAKGRLIVEIEREAWTAHTEAYQILHRVWRFK